MITPTSRKQATLSILQRLRDKGLPEREAKVDSMFDSLSPKEESIEETEVGEDLENDQDGEEIVEKKKKKIRNPTFFP